MMNEDIKYLDLIEMFKPLIRKKLSNTSIQNRSDLEQEILIKMYEKYELLCGIDSPGFFDFLEKKSKKSKDK
jgi:hypothetical protein